VWEAEDWKKRAVKRSEQVTLEDGLKEGLHAYAMRQSDIQTSLADHFRLLWEAPLKDATENNSSSVPQAADNASNVDNPDDDHVDEDEGFDPDEENQGRYTYDDE